jgi:cell cycle arrest protein BUB3
LDIPTSSATIIGRHTGEPAKVACSCLATLDENTVVSAGWNSQCLIWDLRSKQSVATVSLPGKAFSLDVHQNRIVVATSGRRICFIDSKKQPTVCEAELVLDRESSLKYQSRCVRFFPDGSGIALGSIEGRVAVEFLDELGVEADGKKKYAFKCHRINDTVYPVNCIEFHPKFGVTFATGGCDGTVVTWDGMNKKKLAALPKFETSIAALAFNNDGSKLAIASSYTFEEGERDHPRDSIFVRPMLDSECQPKGT